MAKSVCVCLRTEIHQDQYYPSLMTEPQFEQLLTKEIRALTPQMSGDLSAEIKQLAKVVIYSCWGLMPILKSSGARHSLSLRHQRVSLVGQDLLLVSSSKRWRIVQGATAGINSQMLLW